MTKHPLEDMAFSPSRMETLDCPFRFEKLYLEKRKEPVSEPAIVGRVFHDWIALYSKRCLELETNKLRDLSWIKFLDDAVSKNQKSIDELGDTGIIREKTSDMIQGLMDNPVWKLPFEGDQSGLISIEQQWGFRIKDNILIPCGWYDPKVDVRMIADLIWQDGSVLNIIDHKTGWGEPWEYQLPWYAAGTFAKYQDDSWDTLKIHYHWAGKGGQYQEVGFYHRQDLDAITNQVISQIHEARKTTEFPARQCKSCSWCGFKAECPEVHAGASILTDTDTLPVLIPKGGQFQIVDHGTAERALSAIVLVGGRLKELEKDLREFVKLNGPVISGGQKMEQRTSEKWECTNMDGLLNALESDLDITMRDIVRTSGLSKSVLLQVLRKAKCGKELNDLLACFGETKPVINDAKICDCSAS